MDDMNDEDERKRALFEYYLTNSGQQPEMKQLARQQEQINALRDRATEMPQTQMYGRVAVAPSWTQVLGNVAQGLSAGYQQKKLDEKTGALRTKGDDALRQAMDRMMPRKQAAPGMGGMAGPKTPANMTDEDFYNMYGYLPY